MPLTYLKRAIIQLKILDSNLEISRNEGQKLGFLSCIFEENDIYFP